MSVLSSITDVIETNPTWQATVRQNMFPVSAPMGVTGLWVAYRLTQEDREYFLFGVDELHFADLEFKIESPSYLEAHETAKLLATILDPVHGLTGDIIVTSVIFSDSKDGDFKDEILNLFSVICEVSVWYKHA